GDAAADERRSEAVTAEQRNSPSRPTGAGPSRHNSTMREISAATATDGDLDDRNFTFMPNSSRSRAKPECISAATERAHALAIASAGHTPGCLSARYSAIASVSQTIRSPSCRQGTLPLGD